jgi:membrane protease YdiL (CAAX protease family)
VIRPQTRAPGVRTGNPWTALALPYLAGLALAELLTTYTMPWPGQLAHCLLLAALLYHSSRVGPGRERTFLICLAFAPLIRILSLALPLTRFPLVYWYAIVSLPLFAAALVAKRLMGYSWRALGLTLRHWPPQLIIGLSGIAFGVVEYWILRPEPLAPSFTWADLWGPALILLLCTGLVEELIFRGLLQRAAVDAFGRWGILYVAVVYATLYIGYRSLAQVLFMLGAGLFFGWAVERTRSLLGAALAHGLTNVVLFLVMPFL